MKIERFDTKIRSSRVVKYNGVIYFSGHAAEGADITEQTAALLKRMEGLLEEYGTDKEHILTATVYLRTMEDYNNMNEIWNTWIPMGYAPARTTVQAAISEERFLIELTLVAAMKEAITDS